MSKLTRKEINQRIKDQYPNDKIVMDFSSYKNADSVCVFNVNGKKISAIVTRVVTGKVKFRGSSNYKNPLIKNTKDIIDKIIQVTKKKHPTINFKIKIVEETYIDTHTKCKFILNENKLIISTPYNLMKYGISLKDLGLKKIVRYAMTAQELSDKITKGWTDKNKKSYPPRPFISFIHEEYKGTKLNMRFIDSEYGEWIASPYNVVRGGNHPRRSKVKVIKSMLLTVEEAQDKITHGTKGRNGNPVLPRDYLTIVKETYTDTKTPAKFIDKDFGEFSAKPNHIFAGREHPKRSRAKSQFERAIEMWLESLNIDCIRNQKFFNDSTNKEIDVYIPHKKVGIDYHGLYWHCELNRKKKSHQERLKFFKEKDIFLFQIYENEWRDHNAIVKQMILNKIGYNKEVDAKKLKLKSVSKDHAKEILQHHNLKGPSDLSTNHLSLVSKQNKIISMISYHINNQDMVIDRFTCLKKVKGGFKKLIEQIKKIHPKIKNIKITIDHRYEDCSDMIQSGFILKKTTLQWQWTDCMDMFPKKYCKSKKKAEFEGLYKIFDAGQAVYGYTQT